jgi:hypothetical protein
MFIVNIKQGCWVDMTTTLKQRNNGDMPGTNNKQQRENREGKQKVEQGSRAPESGLLSTDILGSGVDASSMTSSMSVAPTCFILI